MVRKINNYKLLSSVLLGLILLDNLLVLLLLLGVNFGLSLVSKNQIANS